MLCLPVLLVMSGMATAGDTPTGGWIRLFDGKGFTGWKASENRDSWTVEQGAFVCHGPRSHLFYVGVGDHRPFKNFELETETVHGPSPSPLGGGAFHLFIFWEIWGNRKSRNIRR